MPGFSGYGPYSSFIPAASDAYSALLSRLPAAMDEKMKRARRKDDLDVEDRNLAQKERKERLRMEKGAIRDVKTAREEGRRASSAAAYAERQDQLRGDLAASDNAQRRAARYGGDPFQAGRIAANERRARR